MGLAMPHRCHEPIDNWGAGLAVSGQKGTRVRTLRFLPVVIATGLFGLISVTSVAGGAASADLVAVPGRTASRGLDAQVASIQPPPGPAFDVLERTNQARARYGLAPVTMHPRLQQAALLHSQDQAANGRMSHAGSDGSTLGQRITAAGYGWRLIAENVAAGQRTAASVTDAWLNSPGHRANMLDPRLVHIGIAVAHSADGTPYWTMDLATPR